MRKKNLSFKTILERFREYLITRNYSDRTVGSYTLRLRFFFRFLKEKRGIDNVLLVTRDDIGNYQSYLYYYNKATGGKFSPWSRYSFIITLSPFFKFLSRNGYIPFNPMIDIELPKLTRSLPRNVMSRREVEKLLATANRRTVAGLRDRAILEVLYSTGIRNAELTNLTLYDIDLQKGFLKVNRGKGQKDRVVPLGKVACKYLKRYLRSSRPKIINSSKHLTLFLTQNGNKFARGVLSKMVQKYTQKAGLKKHISPHSFRHTCATLMLHRGADIRYIQELLGHQSLQTTQIYTRVTVKDLKRAHRRFHPRERKA